MDAKQTDPTASDMITTADVINTLKIGLTFSLLSASFRGKYIPGKMTTYGYLVSISIQSFPFDALLARLYLCYLYIPNHRSRRKIMLATVHSFFSDVDKFTPSLAY